MPSFVASSRAFKASISGFVSACRTARRWSARRPSTETRGATSRPSLKPCASSGCRTGSAGARSFPQAGVEQGYPHAAYVRTTVERANDAVLVHALESHIKTLQGENETLKQQLAAADARAAQEAEKAAKAIEAFADLARRLDALAEANQQRRPWWRRLAG